MIENGEAVPGAVDLTPIEARLDALEINSGVYQNAETEYVWENGLDAIQPGSKINRLLSEGWLVRDMQHVEYTSSKSNFQVSSGILFVLQKPADPKVSHRLVWCPRGNWEAARKEGSAPYKTLGFPFKDGLIYKYGFLFVFQS